MYQYISFDYTSRNQVTLTPHRLVYFQYWELIKPRAGTAHSSSNAIETTTTQFNEDSKFLRDKSASCNVALDISPRPTTVIGLSRTSSRKDKKSKRKVNFEQEKKPEKKDYSAGIFEQVVAISSDEVAPLAPTCPLALLEPTNLNGEKSVSVTSLASVQNEDISFIDEGRELTDRSSMTPDLQKNVTEEVVGKTETEPAKKDPIVTEVNVHDIIKKFDEQKAVTTSKIIPKTMPRKPPDVPSKPEGKPLKIKPAVPPRSATTKLRGRLDKSHSTPAYDLSEEPLEALEIDTKSIQTLDNSLNEIGIPIMETINPILPDLVQVLPEPPAVLEPPQESLEAKNFALEPTESAMEPPKPVTVEIISEPPDHDDLPPKPPPRNFVDLPKPVYPADSPKPQLITPKTAESFNAKQVFEYPDPITGSQTSLVQESVDHHVGSSGFSEEKPPSRNFEPKIASTPVPKKVEPDVVESTTYKSVPSYELQKSVVEKKVSPTNSIVKAMIKGKSVKKKNSLIASEYFFLNILCC